MYYAHIREDGTTQTVNEHLQGTAMLCSQFASQFGESERGFMLGYAHDIGKCSEAFQKRLAGGPKVDHATAGAKECQKSNEPFLAGCVAGHHGGLPDFGNPKMDAAGTPTLAGRLKKVPGKDFPSYHWSETLNPPKQFPAFRDPYSCGFWTRMLYSCLVDADYLDTERFMHQGQPLRSGYDSLPTLLDRLMKYIQPWFPAQTPLNQKRCDILQRCLEKAQQPQGIYSLTVPTGGGKTISSLAFALKHAVLHGMERIIYVIPYTSIIEQNAAVFRQILGAENVIEHHSGIVFDDNDETGGNNIRQRLATENWDAPVIVTTAVQFFESFYQNRPSQCRKLHNIANSVVIFDEAQMIPACHLAPSMGVIANLAQYFHTTAVLCTATQPILEDLLQSFCPELSVQEICPERACLYDSFRRVTYRNGGKLTWDALCQELSQRHQVLCIVNTRKAAQDIFQNLPTEGRFHLSTLMYPQHRRVILQEIRKALAEGTPCRVVSTSLIEAGVDVDFPNVYRELAGLDSIAQAAGRCNREGRRSAAESMVTYFEGENPAPVLQQINIGAAREALACGSDPGDPETIHRYFTAWRSLMGSDLDKSGAVTAFRKGISGCAFPFETVAEKFHFIDQATATVYIPLEEGSDLCRKIQEGIADKHDYRKAGQYSVSVYHQHYQALLTAGDLLPIHENCGILTNLALYNTATGLSLAADVGKAEFI